MMRSGFHQRLIPNPDYLAEVKLPNWRSCPADWQRWALAAERVTNPQRLSNSGKTDLRMKTLRTCLGAILVMLAGDALTLAQAPRSTTQPPASQTASPSAATPPGAAPANAPATSSAAAP